MNKLQFKTLYIYSISEKRAKRIDFDGNKTMITSNSKDGTKRGKSIIMKSLYHSMGADCYFDDKWNDYEKIYIIKFAIDGADYYLFRSNNLFKLFDSDKKIIFKTVHHHDLAENLKKITGFAVELPNRKEDKLEITPPAYNYLPYFIDQDHLNGPNFSSFKNLTQYKDFKEKVLLYHFGVFNSEYFNKIKELETVNANILELNKKIEFYTEMLNKIFSDVKSISYVKNIDKLRSEIANYQHEYSTISVSLSKIKDELIKLRNEEYDISSGLNELKKIRKNNDKDIKCLLNKKCPYCDSSIDLSNKLIIRKYGVVDDIVSMVIRLQSSLEEIELEIVAKEKEYQKWLAKLSEYREMISSKNEEVNDAIKHQGYMEVKDGILEEYSALKQLLNDLEVQAKNLNKQIRQYNKLKKLVNDKYYELMLKDKIRFRLEEINPNKLKKITSVYEAGGSNKPITTVMWYMNLIRIKNEFNKDAISFPIVFDSPNNAETDFDKKIEVYKYLIDNVESNNQLIVSGIGYGEDGFTDLGFDNVIHLENEKYKLLCEKDFNENHELLDELARL